MGGGYRGISVVCFGISHLKRDLIILLNNSIKERNNNIIHDEII